MSDPAGRSDGGPRIGLVLGAGGAVGGAFHAGVLTALHESFGWDAREAELMIGTSAGSVTSALLRAGLPPPDLMARAEGRPLSEEGRAVVTRYRGSGLPPYPDLGRPQWSPSANAERRQAAAPGLVRHALARPWSVRPWALAAGLLPPGTTPTAGIAGAIEAVMGHGWPDKPLWICAVALDTGRLEVFGRNAIPTGGLGPAVAASCAIPGWFAPVEIDGHRYVDGGAHSPTNADLARRQGLDLVVVSAPMSFEPGPWPSRRASSLGTVARGGAHALLSMELFALRRAGTSAVVLAPHRDDLEVMGVDAMDARRRPIVARQVKASMLRRLAHPGLRHRLAALESGA